MSGCDWSNQRAQKTRERLQRPLVHSGEPAAKLDSFLKAGEGLGRF